MSDQGMVPMVVWEGCCTERSQLRERIAALTADLEQARRRCDGERERRADAIYERDAARRDIGQARKSLYRLVDALDKLDTAATPARGDSDGVEWCACEVNASELGFCTLCGLPRVFRGGVGYDTARKAD